MTNQPLRARALDAAAQALNAGWHLLPADGQAAVVDAVLEVADAELDASQRRTVLFVERIGDARAWARTNLTTEQQHQLLAILGGREPRR